MRFADIRASETLTVALFPDCVIPGCGNPVAAVGEPCGACQGAFGPMLRHNPEAPPMTADEVQERDRYVRSSYALQRALVSR
jgi:hypothetical protein